MNEIAHSTVSVASVSRRAWWRWSLLTALSVIGMFLLVPLIDSSQINAKAWFIAPLLWMLLAVPATLGVYGSYLWGGWAADAGPAEAAPDAEDYLRGVTSAWSVLAAGVGLSLAACLLAGSASPGIWPGAFMLMLLVLARPTRGAQAD